MERTPRWLKARWDWRSIEQWEDSRWRCSGQPAGPGDLLPVRVAVATGGILWEAAGRDRDRLSKCGRKECSMSDGAALFAAILAHPAEDTPRLAYADWLDEHGDPDRAACIRLQIEAARLPDGDARRAELDETTRLLVVAHLDAWLGPLRTLATNWLFVRGFPERLTVLHEVFLSHADEILAAAPVRSVFFRKVKLPFVGRLAAMPQLGRVEELNFWHDGLSEKAAEVLVASPHLAGVRSLNLGSNRVRDRGARAVTGSPHLGGLRVLDLSDNRIGDDGALTLAATAGLGQLEVLDLRDNAVSTEGERALRERFGNAVRLGAKDE